MAWVYILRGSSGCYYTGSTTDLERRLAQHRNGYGYATHRLGQQLVLIASLELGSLEEARALEGEMKRKKNPRLALFLLEERRKALSG